MVKARIYTPDGEEFTRRSDNADNIFREARQMGAQKIKLGLGAFILTSAFLYDVPDNFVLEGSGYGTVLTSKASVPLTVQMPSITGSGVDEVPTECFGLMLRSLRGRIADGVAVKNLRIGGVTGTAAAASHASFLHIVAHNTVVDAWVDNQTSDASDSTSTVMSKYKALGSRNFTTYKAVWVGESRYIEPAPDQCEGLSNADITIRGALGEPLNQTKNASGAAAATARATAVHCRKIVGLKVSVDFDGYFALENDLLAEIILTGTNFADGDTFTVVDHDPGTKVTTTRTFEFDNNSSVGGGNTSITIGATGGASLMNALYKINSTCSNAYAIAPADFFVGGVNGTTKVLRVKGKGAPDSTFLGYPNPVQIKPKISGTNLVAEGTDSGGNFFVRSIVNDSTNGQRRVHYWMHGIIAEDCTHQEYPSITWGPNVFEQNGLYRVATSPHFDFNPYEWSEGGHCVFGTHKGDGISVGVSSTTGRALYELADGGFEVIPNTINLGQVVMRRIHQPVFWMRPGSHKAFLLTLASGNMADGEQLEFTDGQGNSRTFVCKDLPTRQVQFSAAPDISGGVYPELKITPGRAGVNPAYFRFAASASTIPDDSDNRVFYVNTQGLSAAQTAAAFETKVDAVFGSELTTSTSTDTTIITDTSWTAAATLLTEVADPQNRMAVTTTKTGPTDSSYHFQKGSNNLNTLLNLRAKIRAAFLAKLVSAYMDAPVASGTSYLSQLTIVTWGFQGSPTLAVTSTHLSEVDYSQPYRSCGGKFEPTVHWASTGSSCAPVLRAEGVYGHLTIGAKVYHQTTLRTIKATATEGSAFVDTSSILDATTQPMNLITILQSGSTVNHKYVDGDLICSIDPSDNGVTNTALTKFAYDSNSSETDNTPSGTYYVQGSIPTVVGMTSALAKKIRSVLGAASTPIFAANQGNSETSGLVVISEGKQAANAKWSAVYQKLVLSGNIGEGDTINCYFNGILQSFVWRNTPPADAAPTYYVQRDATTAATSLASLITKFNTINAGFGAESSGGTAYLPVEALSLGQNTGDVMAATSLASLGLGNGLPYMSIGSNATAVKQFQGYQYPFVLIDCDSVTFSGAEVGDYRSSGYSTATDPPTFTFLTYLTDDANAGLGGSPIKGAFIERTAAHPNTADASITNKAHINFAGLSLKGAFGIPAVSGISKLYDYGANITPATDIKVHANVNFCFGDGNPS